MRPHVNPAFATSVSPSVELTKTRASAIENAYELKSP